MPTTSDLFNKRFEKVGFGGYKTAEVDSFMIESASVVSGLNRETADIKRKLEAAEKKLISYNEEEDNIKTTLLNAQRLADKIIKEAQGKADLTIKEAQIKADLTMKDAQIKAENIVEKAEGQIIFRSAEANRIKQEVSDFKLTVMRLYRSHLELINGIPSEEITLEDELQEENNQENVAVVPESIPVRELEIEESQQKKTVEETGATAVVLRDEQDLPTETQLEKAKQDSEQKQLVQENQAEVKEQATATMKLNLRYNHKTGEYEPINTHEPSDLPDTEQIKKDGIKFGAGYNISTDSFNDGSARRGVKSK